MSTTNIQAKLRRTKSGQWTWEVIALVRVNGVSDWVTLDRGIEPSRETAESAVRALYCPETWI